MSSGFASTSSTGGVYAVGHRHLERDRRRDIQHRLAGYTVIRLTHRRLIEEPEVVAEEIRQLLTAGRTVPTIR